MTTYFRALAGVATLSMALPLAAQEVVTAPASGTSARDEAHLADGGGSQSTQTSGTESDSKPIEQTVAVPEREAKKPAEAAAKSGGSRLIEEIVVTAAKREENLQEVPIAVAAFSGEKLDALGIQSSHDLPKITPGLTYTQSAGYNIVYLRGVGSDAFLPAADQDVPTYLDGVALVQGEGTSDQLGRVSRVEVLKGPQGTLFGRNSTGGAVSIITPDPGDTFAGDVNVEFGNYGALNTLAFVNVPIVEGLAATISGYSNSHQTYQQNDAGATVATYARGGRVKVLWHATDALSFNASGLYGETSNNAAMAKENIRVAPYLKAVVPQDPSADYHLSENVVGGIVQYNYLFAGGAEAKLPWGNAKLITSAQKVYATYANYDYDGSTAPLVSFRPVDEYGKQRTAELQFLSDSDTPYSQYFSFVTGLYYLDGKGGFPTLELQVAANSGITGGSAYVAGGLLDQLSGFRNALTTLAGPVLSGLVNNPITAVSGGILSSKSISGYFQGTFHLQDIFSLADQVNLILGARLDKETRGLEDNRLGALAPVTNQEVDFLRFSVPDVSAVQVPYKVGLQWYPQELTQIYTSVSRGFTAPTYNTVNFFSKPDKLKPQRVDSYELGVKTQLFDQTLTLNAATFYIIEKELLTAFASVTSGGVVRFDNAPRARIYGAEFDAAWQVLPDLDPGLAVVGSFSYLNARYTDYPDARGYDAASGLSFGQGAPLPAQDVAGKQITRTPPISYNIGINQSIPFGDSSRLELAVETNYSAKFYYDPANQDAYANPSYRIVDARTSYFYAPAGMELTAFVKNLTREKYYASVFVLDPGMNVTLNDPRTFGLRLKYTF